jgi:hypothetical protein
MFCLCAPIKWSLIGVEGCVREGSNHRWKSLASVKRGEFDERGGGGEWANGGGGECDGLVMVVSWW